MAMATRRGLFSSFARVHATAVANGNHKYIDPETGYDVFSELSHLKRGKCCGKACRHCPFGHLRATPWERKPINAESGISQRPTLLKLSRRVPEQVNVLCWSGSASSYYALKMAMESQAKSGILLLTMFDRDTGMLPSRDVSLHQVMEQLLCLPQLNLFAVPVTVQPGSNFTTDNAMSSLQALKEEHNCTVTEMTTGATSSSETTSSLTSLPVHTPLIHMSKGEVNELVECIVDEVKEEKSSIRPRTAGSMLKRPNKLALTGDSSLVNFSLFGM